MSDQRAGFQLQQNTPEQSTLVVHGDWSQGQLAPGFAESEKDIFSEDFESLRVDGSGLSSWGSGFMAFLLACHRACQRRDVNFSTEKMPEGVDELLALATAVNPHTPPESSSASIFEALNPLDNLQLAYSKLLDSLGFIGELVVALGRLLTGKANTRWVDFWQFCYLGGPSALAIISLTSVLVGMILAYLGAVQLQQFGAEIYVAHLVVIGTLREMGVLMTAVVMSGRTGAAYAAQLGTMQTNEEIDAITTMGVSPMEFLVVPRILALIVVMPALTLYANLLGVVGGGIVATGMGISPAQYINECEAAIAYTHLWVGLVKSVVFGTLIAIAGCRAGIRSGRSSAAVGEAATKAVVTAIIYLIVADAGINIIAQQLSL